VIVIYTVQHDERKKRREYLSKVVVEVSSIREEDEK